MIQTSYENVYIEGEDVYRIIGGKYHKLSKWVDNVGYYQVVFRLNGKRKYIRVHRLIAETMLPNPKNYKQINHINGNKLDNRLDNLEWCSNQYNTQEAYNNNLYTSTYRCPIKAIDKQTKEVFIFRSIRECASCLKLNRKTITSILKNEKDNNYPYDFRYIESVTTTGDECNQVG